VTRAGEQQHGRADQRAAGEEHKIEMTLRHNTQLLNEKERLAKLINQKKSEN
jgi:hypothetical protein